MLKCITYIMNFERVCQKTLEKTEVHLHSETSKWGNNVTMKRGKKKQGRFSTEQNSILVIMRQRMNSDHGRWVFYSCFFFMWVFTTPALAPVQSHSGQGNLLLLLSLWSLVMWLFNLLADGKVFEQWSHANFWLVVLRRQSGARELLFWFRQVGQSHWYQHLSLC